MRYVARLVVPAEQFDMLEGALDFLPGAVLTGGEEHATAALVWDVDAVSFAGAMFAAHNNLDEYLPEVLRGQNEVTIAVDRTE